MRSVWHTLLPLALALTAVARPALAEPPPPFPSLAFALGYCLYVYEQWPRSDMVVARHIADARAIIYRLRGEAQAHEGYAQALYDNVAEFERAADCRKACRGPRVYTDREALHRGMNQACYTRCKAKADAAAAAATKLGQTCGQLRLDDAWWAQALASRGLGP
jgi:hypothetical protein